MEKIATDQRGNLHLTLWREGMIGIIKVNPRRRIEALIRRRVADGEVTERQRIIHSIKAILTADAAEDLE